MSEAFFAAATLVFVISVIRLHMTRRRTALLARELNRGVVQGADDTALADWARTTDLQVVSKGGTYFSITLAELYTGTAGLPRSWYDPVAVVISNHPADSHG